MMATGLWYPVYDRHLSWIGVKLETDAAETASSDFFAQMIADLRVIEEIGGKLFFVGADVLAADDNSSPLPFPPSQLVIVLNETYLSGGVAADVHRDWRARGARLAVTGLEVAAEMIPDMIGMRILDAATVRDASGEAALKNASCSGTKLFAHGVGSMALFEWCVAQGFAYFTFGRLDYPENVGVSQGTSRLLLMRLLALVTRDAETAEMEAVFKLEPKLAFGLLRLVNSAALGVRTEITSFAQAILVLGRRQLQRWLQLLLFAHGKDGGDGPNILMQRAAERGRMMELLAREGNEMADQELAFMVGVFSVLDVLMATPLAQLLKSITLPQPVEMALLRREGRLGALLDLVCAAEESRFAEVQRGLPSLGMDPGTLSRSQLDAIFWALRIAET
jgi:EAL and modified HD-GYP domain-containing signal transduction protein